MRVGAFIPGFAAALLAAMLPFARAFAQTADVAVDLELILAVDVSRSMDTDEQQLQRSGYVAAITHPDVISAITGASDNSVSRRAGRRAAANIDTRAGDQP